MAYGREMLRKAGQGLLGLDERYANAVREGIQPNEISKPIKGGELTRQLIADIGGVPLNSTKSLFDTSDPRYKPYQDTAMKAASTGVRYGIPALGVTLAGKGLIDLTGMFIQENEQTSGTLMP